MLGLAFICAAGATNNHVPWLGAIQLASGQQRGAIALEVVAVAKAVHKVVALATAPLTAESFLLDTLTCLSLLR